MRKSYWVLPAPKGRRALVLWCIAQAVKLGYEGVCFEIGTDLIQNPGTTDWSDFTACVEAAAKAGLYLRLRGQQNAPRYAYSGGKIIGNSAWVTLFSGGAVWPEPMRPPIAVAVQIAKLVWARAWQIASDAYTAALLNPLVKIQWEGANEPGIKGAGGAYEGDSFGSAKWPATPEGYIEPYFFTMLRAMIDAAGLPHEIVWPWTLEGQYGSAAQNEVRSIVGADALYLLSKYPRLKTNRYTPPSTSAAMAATLWESRWLWQQANVQDVLLKTLGHTVHLDVMESGMTLGNVAAQSTVAQTLELAAACRQTVLMKARTLVDAGMFCAVNTNELTQDFNCFNTSVIGSVVTAAPVGAPVGPKAQAA